MHAQTPVIRIINRQFTSVGGKPYDSAVFKVKLLLLDNHKFLHVELGYGILELIMQTGLAKNE